MTEFNWKKLQNGSDIRGVALDGIEGETVNLTPEVIAKIGKAFVVWLISKTGKTTVELKISVGRDSRLSGPSLRDSLITAMSDLGCHIFDFEIASTPAMFMSTVTENLRCDGAIMLTASHLPFNRNGLKFFTNSGGLDKQDITEILTLAEMNRFPQNSAIGSVTKYDFMSIYGGLLVNKVREGVNHQTNFEQPLQGLKIIVDAGNGAGGFYTEKVLKPLGADISGSQFLEPDGTFPNHIPNPENAEAMASISAAVIKNKADFGIIFDTDVDRSAAVDHQGNELNRNRLIALISSIVLKEHPGTTIVTDSITSDGLTTFINDSLKGKHLRFQRGYKNVINKAMQLNQNGQESWLAIETSGHAAMKENYFLDDGAYLITKLLIELAKLRQENKSLGDLISDLKEPVEDQEYRLKIGVENFKEYGNQVITKLTEFSQNQSDWRIVPNNYEGVRVSCISEAENGWFLLRLSLHDPVIPLNIESNVKGGVEKIANRLLGFFKQFESLDLSVFN